MRSALYYPHTTVENESLVKTALLLWDHLEFIVPYPGFRGEYDDPSIARAMEMIGVPRAPSDAEKRETHKHIKELIGRPLPPRFYFMSPYHRHGEYEIYPQKFLPETWDLLHSSRMSGAMRSNSDYPMSEPAGLAIMSILADCCAGETRARVTDRGEAYATLAGFLGDDAGDGGTSRKGAEQQLVPLMLEVIDIPSLSLSKLIAFREREAKTGGHALRDLRHRYVDGLETYVKRLTTVKGKASDAAEIKRQFADDMKADLANLRDELGFAKRDALLSKEILLTALAAVGTVATLAFGAALPILGVVTATGAPATIGSMASAANKYLSARRSIMLKHPMAYLYQLRH